jgi:hypothetical protein
MAIYAQRPRKLNSYLPDFKLVTTPLDGQAFVYDSQIGAFVNKPVGSSSTPVPPGTISQDLSHYITDGVNLSSNMQIFSQKNNQTLEFKGLIAGGGITLNNMGNDIRIANTVYETGRWQNTGINIVFDQNGKMVFYKRGNRFSFNPSIKYVSANEDITLVAANPGQIVSATQNFEALGLFVGQKISVSGTGEQDGEYTLAGVSTNTLTLTTPLLSNLDSGLQPSTTIIGSRLQFINSITVAVYGIALSTSNLNVGDTIEFTGTSTNDGSYTIASISGNQITINEIFTGPFNSEYGVVTVFTPGGA